MEEILEVALLAELNENDVEDIIVNHLLINHVEQEEAGGGTFNLEEMQIDEIKQNFRFEKADIFRLHRALRLPDQVRTQNRNSVSGVTALCMVLRRLSYPNRLVDLATTFKLSPQAISNIINHTISVIINQHGHLLSDLQNLRWLNKEKMQYYAHAISEKGGALTNCWGFIDGTARPICRPSVNQENYYSGHKRHHCLKYQSVLCPDGIIVSLKGAYPGRRHDAGIFRDSNLYEELETAAVFPNNEKYVLYGDQAYGVIELLLCPYPNRPNMPAHHKAFNISMRTLRIAVEWGFGKVISQFAFVDFKKNQKLLLQDLENIYKVAVLLNNCHTCLYSCQTAQYFNVTPPQLETYLESSVL